MSPTRLARIPFEHVEAELAAFPIASEASFRSGLVCLEPVASRVSMHRNLWPAPEGGIRTARQLNLARVAERDILLSVPSVPLDEFVAIRDRVWFGNSAERVDMHTPIPLVRYLRRLSEQYLDESGRPVDPPSSRNGNEDASSRARLRWSWLCRALPADLLRAGRGVAPADESPFSLSPNIDRLLREIGYAETHLHLGAATDFSLLWANFMRALAEEEIPEDSLESSGACFDEGREFAKWIAWAAVVRLVLAEWLFDVARVRQNAGLAEFTTGTWHRRMKGGTTNDLLRLVSEFEWGHPGTRPLSFARGRAIYRLLRRPLPFGRGRGSEGRRRRTRNKSGRERIFENDPLARVVGWQWGSGSSPEMRFVEESLRHLERNEGDSDFARLFWQVVRVRCLLYRHLAQRPMTPGLQWFVRFFSRIKPVRGQLPKAVRMQAAIRSGGGGCGLRSLEVRVGTEAGQSDCLDILQKVNEAGRGAGRLETGAVFHFSRDRGGGWRQGVPNAHGLDHSYPGVPADSRLRTSREVGNPSGLRFARFYLEKRGHAQALVSVLRGFPRALRTLRGVDLCTDEAGVPVWVMAPLVRWVRESGRTAAAVLRDRGITDIPPLRATIHAGEDFVHLLSGLRRLDDAIRHLGLEEGDRIGHGMALGLDPTTWFERVGRIVQSREERLLDLVWEWDFYATRGVAVGGPGRLAYLTGAITRLAREMFEETCAPEELVRFVRLLHCERELRAAGFPDRPGRCSPAAARFRDDEDRPRTLLREYLGSTEVWRKGRVLETITLRELPHELDALRTVQGALRREVGTRGLTVEVNPSSNLLIGDLGRIDEHPIWRLRPVRFIDDIPPLSVCIGSDDPLTFATTLPHEYQLLFDTIVLSDGSHEEALDWLEHARAAGMRARFTLPRRVTRTPERLLPALLRGRRPSPVQPP